MGRPNKSSSPRAGAAFSREVLAADVLGLTAKRSRSWEGSSDLYGDAAMVVVIYTGERWEVSQGRYFGYKGTASYLKNIGAWIVPNSAEVIDADEVDEQGRLRLPVEERGAR
jgi:hypothetical protein